VSSIVSARFIRQERRVGLAVALAVLAAAIAQVVTLYAPNTWINRDGRFYTNMNTTLAENGSLLQEDFAASWYDGSLGWNRSLPASFSNIALGRNGEHWPMHPWLMPVMSTPLFFAFGIAGTLMFNLLMFAVIAAATYRFAREHASSTASAVAAGTLLLGTSVHEYAYDYHVDIMLLALFTAALAALVSRRGTALGVLFAACLVIKPTCLILAPALLLLLWERRDGATFRRAAIGGAVVLGAVACVNTWMFGRPWWFGYTRVLTVENGEPVVFTDTDAFATPLSEGLPRTWSGAWGLTHRQTLVALALPGLLSLLAGRPLYAFAALVTALGSLFLFAKYHFEGDRFHWPAIALLSPALAASFDLLGRVARTARRRWRPSADSAAPLAAAAVCALALAATFPFGQLPTERLPDDGYVTGALALGQDGTFDLRDRLGPDYLSRRHPAESVVTRSRFGHWLPRASPIAVLVAAPFTSVGGRWGLVVLAVLAVAVAAWSMTRILTRVAPPAVAAAVTIAPLLLPWVRDTALASGPHVLAAACALLAIALALRRRWVVAGALAVLSAWVADAPWLVGLGVLVAALFEGGRAPLRALAGTLGVALAWGVSHLVLIGRPFASPDDFVLVDLGGRLTTAAFESGEPLDALADGLATGPGRLLVGLLVLAPLGLIATFRRDPRVAVLLAFSLFSVLAPGALKIANESDLRSPLLVMLAWAPLAASCTALAWALCSFFERMKRHGRTLLVIAVAGALLVIGGTWRAARAAEPFRMASERGLRTARVLLAERIPCDFIPWEHMSWECSHYDRGHFNQVGFALPEGVEVGGERSGLLLVPTGNQGQARTVTWSGVEARARLRLRHATPDRAPGGVRVQVLVNGEEVDRFEVPAAADGVIRERIVDTARVAGETIELALRVTPAGRSGAAVAIDGELEGP